MTNPAANEAIQMASEVIDLALAARLRKMADELERGIDIPRAKRREAYARACMIHGPRSQAAVRAWRDLNDDIHHELRRTFR